MTKGPNFNPRHGWKMSKFVDEIFVSKMSKLNLMEMPEYVENLLTKEISYNCWNFLGEI